MTFDLGIQFHPIEQELTIFLIALLFDAATRLLLPAFRDRMAPVAGIVAGVSLYMRNKLNRDYRERKTLVVRGSIAMIILLALSVGAAVVIDMLVNIHPRGMILAAVVVFSCLAVTVPWSACVEVIAVLKSKNVITNDAMRVLERRRVTRDLQLKNPDKHAIARAVIEVTARSFDRGLLSPAFWYLVPSLFGYSGIIGLLLATAITEMDRVVGGGHPQDDPFSLPFVTLDQIVHYVPARLAALLLWMGSFFTPSARPFSAFKCLVGQSHKHRSVNAGWPVAIMAGAMRVALAGGARRDGWIGSKKATAKAGWPDVRRALVFHYVTFFVGLLVLMALLFLSLGL